MLILEQTGTTPVSGPVGVAPAAGGGRHDGVQAEQVRLLYGLAPAGLFAGLLAGLVVAVVLRDVAPRPIVYLWIAALLAVMLARLGLVRRYSRIRGTGPGVVADPARWLRHYCVVCFAAGSVWGGGALLLAMHGDIVHQLFLVLTLTAVSAGAMSTMIASPRALCAFLLPAVLPPAAWLLAQATVPQAGLGAALLLAALFLARGARHLNGQLLRSLTLAMRNEELVADLSRAKARLEDVNRELIREVEDRTRAEDREKERVQVTLESIGDGVITTDVDARVEYLNPVAEQMTGWSAAQARGRPLPEVLNLVDEGGRSPVGNPVRRCLQEGAPVCVAAPTSLLHRGGDREFSVKVTAAPLRAREREVIGAVLVFHDVTELRSMARRMAFQASHDALTRLINRHEFEGRLEQALAGARGSGRVHALCFLDLDRFKQVNDTCGHEAGDELLRQLAACLKARMRERDSLARLGGDEFGALFLDCPADKGRELAESLLDAVRGFRFSWGKQSFEVGASIGVVPVDGHSGGVGEVMNAADSACYAAKEGGRNRVHVYREEDAERTRRHGDTQWAQRIRLALRERRLRLHFQPIRHLGGNGGGGELLLRMLDEGGRLVAPRVFLPAAERHGLMTDIDHWVVDSACSALDEEHRLVRGLQHCNINLSPQSMADGDFLAATLDRLRVSPRAAQVLCFEIAETAAIANLSTAMQFITEVRALGCRFALDDFGAGLSSFAYLRTLPVDFLKIDGAFVKDMLRDPVDHAMVDAINRIGHLMGVRTVAEFVEDGRTLESVRRLGVDYAQGYGVGAPCALES